MKTQKLLLKAVYCLTGLLFIASISLNIFQYQKIRKLSEDKTVARQTVISDESADNPKAIIKEESIDIRMTAPEKMVQESTFEEMKPVINEEIPRKETTVNEIDELEYHLSAAEEELDMTSEQLSSELTKKTEFKKATALLQKKILTDPAYKKRLWDSMKQELDKNYDPLYGKLGLSAEEFDEFKGVLADQMMESQDISAQILEASTADEKEKINRQILDIAIERNKDIRNFLGEEKYSIYESYVTRLPERNALSGFIESIPNVKRISDHQLETLINAMHEAGKSVRNDITPGDGIRSPFDINEKTLARQMERTARTHEKYVEASRHFLTSDEAEQFDAYLRQQRELTESVMKMSSYVSGKGSADQEGDEE